MVWPIKIVTKSAWPQKMVQDQSFFDHKKLNSLAIAARSVKPKNYAENINYHIFLVGEQLLFFYGGVVL